MRMRRSSPDTDAERNGVANLDDAAGRRAVIIVDGRSPLETLGRLWTVERQAARRDVAASAAPGYTACPSRWDIYLDSALTL